MMNSDTRLAQLNAESAIAMAERTIRRLFILLVVLILMWGATIGGFIWYLNQYDFESYEIAQDGEGLNFVGRDWSGVNLSEPTGTYSQTSP